MNRAKSTKQSVSRQKNLRWQDLPETAVLVTPSDPRVLAAPEVLDRLCADMLGFNRRRGTRREA